MSDLAPASVLQDMVVDELQKGPAASPFVCLYRV
jgi:hypothetical protein